MIERALDETRLPEAGPLRDPALAGLLAVLNGDGEETRLVGGSVRNALLGIACGDVDLATTATPDVVARRSREAGYKSVPTGIDHGTVTVVVGDKPFEVTTLRADIDTDGRRAKVAFGRSFAEDALRRDFTMNALYATADGRVIDYVGGIADLRARRIRFIGDARQRIREDFLRILRFFRFLAAYGEGPPDADAMAATIAERQGLAQLSRERVRAELLKLLVARRAADAAEMMSDAGLLQGLLGGIAAPARLRRLAAIASAGREPPDAILGLAGLAVFVAEDASRLRDALRLSNEEAMRLRQAAVALARLHGRTAPPGEPELRRMLFLDGRRAACDALMLAHAESAAAVDALDWRTAHRIVAEAPRPRLPIGGTDVMARGIAGGPAVGEVLKNFQAAWIRAGFPAEPDRLARLLDEILAAQSGGA